MPLRKGLAHMLMLRAGYLLSMQEHCTSLQRAKYCPGGRVLDSALGPGFVYRGIAAHLLGILCWR